MQPACEGPVAASRWAARPRLPKSNKELRLDQSERIAYPVRRTSSLFADARERGYQTSHDLESPHAQIPCVLPRNPSVGPAAIGSGSLPCSTGGSYSCARRHRTVLRRDRSTPRGPRLSRASFLESRHSNAKPGGRHKVAKFPAQRFRRRFRHGATGHGATWGRRAVSVLGNLVSQYLGPGPRCEMGACWAGFVGDVSRLDGWAERRDVNGRG